MAGISKRVSGAWVSGSERIMKTATDTITTLPAVIYPNDTSITVGVKGQSSQSGTPSPSNPVEVQGVGNKTANLFDIGNITHEFLGTDGAISYESAMDLSVLIRVDGDYTVSWNAVRSGAYMRVSTYDDNKNFIARIVAEGTYTHSSYSNTHIGYIRINYENSYQLSDVQVNTGSTALPYEPYGYKIPILLNSDITNIYIGDEPLRKSLDGTAVDELAADGTLTRRVDSDGSVLATPVVTQITMPTFTVTAGETTLAVDTTVQPSEVTATYEGWHTGTVHERENGSWD